MLPPENEKTDEEITVIVQRGDAEAFGLLVDRYEDKMKRYAIKFIHDREDIKDLVQDVFIKAYTNIQSFNPKRRFSPWLYRVAHNHFVNSVKQKISHKIFPLDLDTLFPYPVSTETAHKGVIHQELSDMLDKCLSRLDPKYREPIILYYYEDMDYKTIAEVIQIPVSTVGVRINRGKKLLKKIYEQLEKNVR